MNFNRDLLSKLIRLKRAEEGLSYRDTAKILGLSIGTITHISKQKGKGIPSVLSLYKACNWLGITPNDLFISTNTNEQTNIQQKPGNKQ